MVEKAVHMSTAAVTMVETPLGQYVARGHCFTGTLRTDTLTCMFCRSQYDEVTGNEAFADDFQKARSQNP